MHDVDQLELVGCADMVRANSNLTDAKVDELPRQPVSAGCASTISQTPRDFAQRGRVPPQTSP